MQLREAGVLIKEKRIELGLTQSQLANLSDLSRTTINHIESGTIKDIGFNKLANVFSILGLSIDSSAKKDMKQPIAIAARTASTSYKNMLTTRALKNMLRTGVLVKDYESHMTTLLDEAPIPVVIGAIKSVASSSGTPIKTIMKNVSNFSNNLGVYRKNWK